ncbi:hypothetical protein M2323_001842 [Rhodoblastus acidophilus]|nr:hypothetical protein [Rhodoblastus acidophilus]
MLEGAAGVFGQDRAGPSEPTVDLKALHAKIGELALENDFLCGALSKAGLLSAKKFRGALSKQTAPEPSLSCCCSPGTHHEP